MLFTTVGSVYLNKLNVVIQRFGLLSKNNKNKKKTENYKNEKKFHFQGLSLSDAQNVIRTSFLNEDGPGSFNFVGDFRREFTAIQRSICLLCTSYLEDDDICTVLVNVWRRLNDLIFVLAILDPDRTQAIMLSDFVKQMMDYSNDVHWGIVKQKLVSPTFSEGPLPYQFQAGFSSFFPSIPVTVKLEPSEDSVTMVSDAVKVISQLNDNFTSTFKSFHKISQVGVDIFETFEKSKDFIVVGFAICFALRTLLDSSSRAYKISTLTFLGVILSCHYSHYLNDARAELQRGINAYISNLNILGDNFEPQSLDNNVLITALLAFMSYRMVGKNIFLNGCESKDVMKFIQEFGGKRDNAIKTFNDLLNLFETLVNFISDKFLSGQPIHVTNTAIKELDVLMARVDDLTLSLKKGELEINMPNYNYIFQLIKDLDSIAKVKHDKEQTERVRYLVGCYRHYLNKIVIPFERAALHASGTRMEPLTVVFKGPPGVGKTHLIVPTLIRLMGKVFDKNRLSTLDADYNSHIYYREPESKYWEGYRGQFATVIDDFGQFRDYLGNNDSEFLDVIRCSNLFTHACHMASMENKGNTFFRSEVLLCTTNLPSINVQSIISSDAVERRFDFIIDVRVKKEYSILPSSGREDQRRVNKAHPIFSDGKFHSEIWEFHISETFTGQVTSILTYEQLVDALMLKYNAKRGANASYQASVRLALDEACAINMDSVSVYEESLEMEPQAFNFDSIRNVCDFDCRAQLLESAAVEFEVARQRFGLTLDQLKAYVTNHPAYKTVEPYRQILAVLGLVGAAFGALAGLTHLFSGSCDQELMVSESRTNSSNKSGRVRRARSGRHLGNVRVEDTHDGVSNFNSGSYQFQVSNVGSIFHPQDCNLQFELSIDNIMETNSFDLFLGALTPKLGSLLFVRDQWFVLPKHYIAWYEKYIEENPEHVGVLFKAVNFHGETISISIDDLREGSHSPLSDRDILLCHSKSVKMKKNIVNMFIHETDMGKFSTAPIRFVNRTANKQRMAVERAKLYHKRVVTQTDGSEYVIATSWIYPIPTRKGDCGSVILIEGVNTNSHRLCGIHIAGNLAAGMAAFVCCEDFSHLNNAFHPEVLPFKGNFIELGTCKSVPGQYQTKIAPSKLHNTFAPSKKRPAALRSFVRNGEVIVPRILATEKYGIQPLHAVDEDLLITACDHYFSKLVNLRANDKTHNFRILSFDESVLGCDDDKFIKSLPRDTSPGYPYNTYPEVMKMGGKKYWFGAGDNFEMDNERVADLKIKVENIIECAKGCERTDVYYVDVLKDELRKHEKVDKGDTRLVSASPLDYTLAVRMYFGKFVSFLMKHNFDASTGVGMNVYSHDWDRLAHLLQSKGDCVIDGDFKCFDGSQLAVIHQHIIISINKFLGGSLEEQAVRTVLYEDLYRSKHVSDVHLYQWQNSLPSGHPLTTIINSIYNNIAFRYIWMLLHPRGELGIVDFDRYCFLMTYGDDNIINVSKTCVSWFNQVNFVDAFKDVGLTYTSADKESTIQPYKELKDCTFLKRGFSYSSIVDRFVAPLELDTILESPQWTKKGELSEVITRQNIDNFVAELSLHNQDVFDLHIDKFVEACAKYVGYTPSITIRRLLHRLVCEREDYY